MQQGQHIDFPKLLGQEAAKVEQLFLKNGFKQGIHNPQSYISEENFKIQFGLNCSRISFSLDEDSMLNSVILSLVEVVNKEIFELLNQEFGKPVGIKVIDHDFPLKKVSETRIDDNHTVRKGYVTLKEGTFEDNPLFVIWKMGDYEVILKNNYPDGFNLGSSMLVYRYPFKQ